MNTRITIKAMSENELARRIQDSEKRGYELISSDSRYNMWGHRTYFAVLDRRKQA